MVAQRAADVGLSYDIERIAVSNTAKAHEALHVSTDPPSRNGGPLRQQSTVARANSSLTCYLCTPSVPRPWWSVAATTKP